MLGPSVEALDAGEEVAPLGGVSGVHEHLGRDPRLGRAQSQRRVEVAGLEEDQGVHRSAGGA